MTSECMGGERQSQMNIAFDKLQTNVKRLHDEIAKLTSRLSPILFQEESKGKQEFKSDIGKNLVPMAAQIEEINSEIVQAIDKIRDMIQSAEC